MSAPVTIHVENLTLRFPRKRVTLGSIEHSLANLLHLRSHTADYFTALKGVSLKVRKGEVLGIIGRNGAGKSTLLRVISGIYRPDEGHAFSRGYVTLLAGLGVGFNVNLSGRENVYLYGSILGHSKPTMDSLMDKILEFSGLEKFIDEPLRTYSSGMRARLGFSVASVVKPEILLIDEVLGVGDVEFRERSKQRIKELVADAGTVVVVSHSLSMLKELCNTMILIEQGRIEAQGSPEEVVELYLGGN